jgi:hypothetical protein
MAKQIKNLLATIFDHKDNWKLQLLQHWPTILGNLNTRVHLEKINDDHLVLGVADSCWLQELYMLSPLLIQTINKKLDVPRIKSLRFKKIGIQKEKEIKAQPAKRLSCKTVPLSVKEQQALHRIEDPELRTAIAAFLRRCQQES